MTETKPCKKCGEDKPLSAYWLQPNGKRAPACYRCRNRAGREAKRPSARSEFDEALRDDVRSAMFRARSRRALEAVHERPSGLHRIKLRYERGYISIGELACRCIERDACFRAAQRCTTVEGVNDAASLLERTDASTPDRSSRLDKLWRTEQPSRATAILRDASGADEDSEGDPFEEAFGDWAPSWVSSPSGLSSHLTPA